MFGIILGIFQSFFNALGLIITKKVVENKKIGNNLQTLVTRFNHMILIIGLFVLSSYIFDIKSLQLNISSDFWNLKNIFLLIFSTLGLYTTYPLRRIAYSNEKVSTLQPYAMLFQVFPIILGFIFIASERANFVTFLTAITASFVVIIPNVDWKNLKMNKYSFMVLISSIIKSIQVFATLYFLTLLSPSNFYFIESMLIVFISLSLLLLNKETKEIRLITNKYAKLIFSGNIITMTSILISLYMYKSLGVVLTSLLSLLYLMFVYILGYFILKEKPIKKDIMIAFLVSILIIIGVFFKGF